MVAALWNEREVIHIAGRQKDWIWRIEPLMNGGIKFS